MMRWYIQYLKSTILTAECVMKGEGGLVCAHPGRCMCSPPYVQNNNNSDVSFVNESVHRDE